MEKTQDIAAIYSQYVDDLSNYALYLGFEKDTVLDAVHDVFAKLASDEKTLREIENVKFYLFRSLKNRLFDITKTFKPHLSLSEIDTAKGAPFNMRVTIEDLFIDEEERQSAKNRIEEMLATLTPRQREIIYLRYIQEYDYPQISELLNISVHGCRKLVSKAMLSLREKYGTLVFLLLLP